MSRKVIGKVIADQRRIEYHAVKDPVILFRKAQKLYIIVCYIVSLEGGKGVLFFFSILCVAIVYFVSLKARGTKILGLVLSGIMVSSLFTAGTSYIKLVADPTDQLPKITYWLLGSLAGTKINDVIFAAVITLAGLIPLLLLRWRINVLTFGDDEARTMGINAKRIRLIVILCSTLVTAASVSVPGMIGCV